MKTGAYRNVEPEEWEEYCKSNIWTESLAAAIAHINEAKGATYELVEVKEIRTQVVAGTNTYMKLVLKAGGAPEIHEVQTYIYTHFMTG
ncbi:hypothetical protein KIPB_013084 [Kipferlia bialata]|uniref:Cystatin domain-containing protein n=1 Tax=Kipferlia bialata TaxID=797122 RepID=A0A391P104_9EUKA|nr:hypothetical protein KIPB_013084 [Kipferlia bialata]|eukprot:g13084.t1